MGDFEVIVLILSASVLSTIVYNVITIISFKDIKAFDKVVVAIIFIFVRQYLFVVLYQLLIAKQVDL